jgi:hypothetical protein
MNGKWSLASRAPLALCLTMALISLTGCPADEPSTNNDTKDLCAQVTCDAPPASSCDGDNAVTYAATGTCDATDGMCDYAEAARTNCADSGQVCTGGVCMNTNPGQEICDDSADNDNDGKIDCMDTDCAAAANCQDVDKCEGVTCDMAPTPTCDGTSLVTYAAAGTCDAADGMCDYAEASRVNCADTGEACMAGACVAPTAEICDDNMDNDGDSKTDCDDEDCADAANCQPVAEICDDNMDNDGDSKVDCDDEDCAADAACQPATPGCLIISQYMEGSSNNKALEVYNCGAAGDADLNLTGYLLCQTNRNSSGVAGNTLSTPMAGTLAAGAVTVYCNAGEAVLPAGLCDGANRIAGQVLGFNGNDTVYIVKDVNGDSLCDAGDMVLDAFGHLAGDTGASPSWADTSYDRCDLTPFDGAGAEFSPLMPVRYVGAPQDSVDGFGMAPSMTGCPQLVAEVCDDNMDNDLDGKTDCDDMDCAADVACLPPDLCMGVMCDMPPMSECDGTSAVTYMAVGTCNSADGMCSYAEATRTDCAAQMMLCMAGACVAPPAEVCNDNTDNDLDGDIDCADADCAGSPLCLVDLCIGVTCDMPPVDSCDDQVAVTYPASGMCNSATGMCLYTETRTDCAAQMMLCSNGACVAPPAEICTDGADNDLDGAIDCADSDCAADAACQVATPCLIISEYIEGSGSNNKAIELFNCGTSALTLDDYRVCVVANAGTGCTSSGQPTGTLAAGAVYKVCVNAATTAGCDLVYGSLTHNGDDRIVVFKNNDMNASLDAADQIMDVFGQIAVRPGSTIWGDKTYRRCDFTPVDGQSAFTVSDYYTDAMSVDDYSNFGTAPVAGCP